MRFKRGSKVEVMNKEDMLTSWRCAEILSRNLHAYNVRYDCYLGTSEVAVERVSRKFIRPCPPPAEGVQSWLAGDIVEVFDDNSWKTATVSKVCGEEYYFVRLLGATQEFRVHKLSIRVRQSWQYDKWVVIGKGSGSCADVEFCKLSTSNCYQKMSFQAAKVNPNTNLHGGDDYLAAVQNNTRLQESHMVSSRTLKRASPYGSSLVDAYSGNVQKIRATKEGSKRRRLVPAPLREKVDAVTYPRENLGEEYMHASFNNRSNGYYELKGRKLNGVVGNSLARSSEPSGSDSDACSVGSCSVISRSPIKFSSRLVAFRCQEPDTLCSDAESLYCPGEEEDNCSLPTEEEVTASIHRLELHAYRCTLGALYASGPLTWDKEALLTNLRITLHISNDEHLMELRNLISDGAGILS